MFVTVAKAASPFVGASTRLVVARVAFSLRLTLHQGDLVRSTGAALESQGRWLGLLVVFLMFFSVAWSIFASTSHLCFVGLSVVVSHCFLAT